MLKKEISSSEKLGAVKSDKSRVLYFMMLPHLDAVGRLEANTRRIKGQITTMLPYTEKVIQTCLEELNEARLLILYINNDKQYIEYTRFGDFQRINSDREAESKIPSPTQENSGAIQITPPKLSEVKLNSNEDKTNYLSIFDIARKLCGGTKRGNATEFENFVKKHKDWKESLGLLLPAIQNQLDWRLAANGEFRPQWKNFRTWINQRCWEDEVKAVSFEPPKKTKLFPIAGKTCGEKGCDLPAIYKNTGGAYDSFKCGEHMPEKVKAFYC